MATQILILIFDSTFVELVTTMTYFNVFNPQNECSFVSLRDVERAMIVLEYFYEKMDNVFSLLMDRRGKEEHDDLYIMDIGAGVNS